MTRETMTPNDLNGTRKLWIDAFRGFAIICMVPANLAPYLSEPHPLWFRIAGSYAAPMFISLSAAMVLLRANHHTLKYYYERAAVVVGCGVFLDLFLWKILPFTSFDVLYIIGPGILFSYFLRHRSPGFLFAATAVMFVAAALLQAIVGYEGVVCEIYLNDLGFPGADRILRSWFIDGWFPIIPWTGFTFLGVAFFRYVFDDRQVRNARRFVLAGIACTVIGFLLLLLPIEGVTNLANNGIIESRAGYSEIFYAPGLPYLASAAGIVMLLAILFRRIGSHPVFAVLDIFGRYSMLTYILHQVLGVVLVSNLPLLWGAEMIDSGAVFALATIGVLVIIAAVCLLLDRLKKFYRPKNVIARVLVGR